MTEAEWKSCHDPLVMLDFLLATELDPRKARLYGVAVCRRIWHLLYDERSKRAVEASEAFADGRPGTPLAEVEDAAFAASQSQFDHSILSQMGAYRHAAMAAWWVAGDTKIIDVAEVSRRADGASVCDPNDRKEQEEPAQASLLRDIFGPLPFRSISIDPLVLTAPVLAVAQAAYEDRTLPGGTLDPQRLLVLADALEEAGGDHEILEHLRAGGNHVRGCWVVDLILSKQP
jgi:hypothetical protein